MSTDRAQQYLDALRTLHEGGSVPGKIYDELRNAKLVSADCERWRGLVGTPTKGKLTTRGLELLQSK